MMRLYVLLFLLIFSEICHSQNVKISRDINVKNDFAYDLIHFSNQYIFYRDKGFKYFFDIFDADLNFKRTTEITFEEKRVFIENIHDIDSTLCLYYSYTKDDTFYIKGHKYNTQLLRVDTIDIYSGKEKIDIGDLRYTLSEDKSKLLLFYFKKKSIFSFVIDTRNFKLESYIVNELKDIDLREDFEEVIVNNKGEVFYLFENNNSPWSSDSHFIELVSISNDKTYYSKINANNIITIKSKMKYDNKNNQLVIAGLWSEKNDYESYGYFLNILNREMYVKNTIYSINTKSYDDYLLREVTESTKNKKNILNDFRTKSLLLRQDGGVILISELQREYSRRFSSVPVFDRNISSRTYVDYYCDDLIVFSINPDGSLFWRKVLFKKQFSQDDDGIYSSFLVLRAPTSVHIIFNDEIKNNNTVSEYVIDPLGNYKRNSILSTEYKNLKLRFKDGIQTSASSFVVPSEKGGKINIVKVTL